MVNFVNSKSIGEIVFRCDLDKLTDDPKTTSAVYLWKFGQVGILKKDRDRGVYLKVKNIPEDFSIAYIKLVK